MIVADASVILKWVLPGEAGEEKAASLRAQHVAGARRIAVPVLLFYEVANTLALTERLPADAAREALLAIAGSQLVSYSPSVEDLQRAAELARQCRITAYDAAYIALAEALQCDFVTADARLANKVRGADLGCCVRVL